MHKSDKQKFAQIIFGLGEYKRVKVTDMALEIYWRLLEPYDINEIDQTILRMLADPSANAFMPQAHEIIAALPSQKTIRWMSADEAWPIVTQAFDQNATVVFPNEESRRAWHEFAEPVFSHRDHNPARMAFRSAYDRFVADAKADCRQPKASISLGHDPESRQQPVDEAVRRGYLTYDDVPPVLMIDHEPVSAIGQHIAGLLSVPTEKLPPITGQEKARLAKLREAMMIEKTPEQVLAEYESLKGQA